MWKLKETLRKVNQCHLLVIVEGSISLRYCCLPAAVMSLGMQLCCSLGSACYEMGGWRRSGPSHKCSKAFGSSTAPSKTPSPAAPHKAYTHGDLCIYFVTVVHVGVGSQMQREF